MVIYTKTGDQGESSLFDGGRVKKYDLRLQAYGELDYFSVVLGKVKFLADGHYEIQDLMQSLQEDLLILSTFLATKDPLNLPERIAKFDFRTRIQEFEDLIDEITVGLPELHNFIMAGTNELELACHEARVLCRKCERLVVELMDADDGGEVRVISYERNKRVILSYLFKKAGILFLKKLFNYILCLKKCLAVL